MMRDDDDLPLRYIDCAPAIAIGVMIALIAFVSCLVVTG